MSAKKKNIEVRDIVLCALPLILLVGLLTFLKSCGPKEDGTWMVCHWAERALAGGAAAMLVLAAVRFFMGDDVKIGLDIGLVVLSLYEICVPGHLIGLCMMDTMRCHTVMTPGVTVISALTAAAAFLDIILRRKKKSL